MIVVSSGHGRDVKEIWMFANDATRHFLIISGTACKQHCINSSQINLKYYIMHYFL